MATEALLIMGLQLDYCRGGAVEVDGADQLVPLVNEWTARIPLSVFIQDWYPPNHCLFAANHLWRKPGQQLTLSTTAQAPPLAYELTHMHCVQESFGAEPATGLVMNRIRKVIRRGLRPDVPGLSAFADLDQHPTGLHTWLQQASVTNVILMGTPLETLVYQTALAAVQLGYQTSLVSDGCRALSADQQQQSYEQLRAIGVSII